jgi:hypothetical protein
MIYKIHNSYIYCSDNYGIIDSYCQYVIKLLQEILCKNPEININIIFMNNYHKITNSNKTITINFNLEHTLVKQGGRDSKNAPIGIVNYDNSNNYLVRIDRYHELIAADIIIDYSIPNIHNVKTSNLFQDFSDKHIYIASSIYNTYVCKENRNISCLTTFINTNEPRRLKLLDNINRRKIQHTNINNCFETEKLDNLYKNTKILINIHQTDHHDTFEELRVLPALQCGVIVVCENSPLNNLIPYNDYIIWANYDDILDTVHDIINNYDHYYDFIFKTKKNIKLHELNNINYNNLNNEIIKKCNVLNKTNITLITSVINTSSNPLSYTNTRSFWTKEERYEQTKKTIESVRKYIPNNRILLMECSQLTESEKKYFIENTDYFLNLYDFNDPLILERINSRSKSMGEGTMTIYAIEFILKNNIKFDNFFKISGRYWLNYKFNYVDYHNNKNTIIKMLDNDLTSIFTCLYKLNYTTTYNWLKYLINSEDSFANCHGFENIFGLFLLTQDKNDQIFINKQKHIGINGYISCANEYIDI